MYNIDLLKGQGIPIQSKPGGVYLTAVSFVVPVILSAAVFGNYLHNRILIESCDSACRKFSEKLVELTPRLEERQANLRQKAHLYACRNEVADVIHWHIQWSPVLEALAQNMTKSMVLEKLEVRNSTVPKQVPNRYNPKETISIEVPRWELSITLSAEARGDDDEMVNQFVQQLPYSPLLAGRNIYIPPVSRNPSSLKNTVTYEIKCVFLTE